MTAVEREIASQPGVWRQAAALGRGLDLFGDDQRVGILGCGTSYHVAVALARLREDGGGGETDAFVASEPPRRRRYQRVIALSRSATTTEVVRALDAYRGEALRIAVVGRAGHAVGGAADQVVVLDFADEESIVQTRFATAVLALGRSALGESLTSAITDAERALRDPLPIDPAAFDRHVFLAHGWCYGLALEAALKLREAAQAWAEAYPAMEYRHGPVALAGPDTAIWFIGPSPDGLGVDLARTGATLVHSRLDPLAQLVVAQRAAVSLALARGLDPDHPRNLTRSVILPASA